MAGPAVALSSTPELRIDPYWWEAEEGLLAPAPGREDAFTWAICASHILRNLAARHARDPLPIWTAVELAAECLQVRPAALAQGHPEAGCHCQTDTAPTQYREEVRYNC